MYQDTITLPFSPAIFQGLVNCVPNRPIWIYNKAGGLKQCRSVSREENGFHFHEGNHHTLSGEETIGIIISLPWTAARRRVLLFALETRALWDLVAGLRLLVGVLLSGVPLPLSFSLSILSLSLAPEGGIASNICSMLENPGAQIDADLVFLRSECSAILLAVHQFHGHTIF